MSWPQRIEQALAERRLNAAYRRRQTTEGGNGRQIRLGARLYLNFSGNDYLGLSQDARVIAAWQQGAQRYGVGSGGSGHVTGFAQRIRRWRSNWRSGSAIRARCCSSPVTPPTRRCWRR